MPFPNLNGRPVEYTEDVPNKVIEYIAYCAENKELPLKAGLAVYIGVSKKTLLNWADKSEQLLHALETMESLQENEVWQRALRGEYNSNIAKLLLYNHGYSDKVTTDNTNKNVDVPVDETLPPEQRLKEVLQRIQELQK